MLVWIGFGYEPQVISLLNHPLTLLLFCVRPSPAVTHSFPPPCQTFANDSSKKMSLHSLFLSQSSAKFKHQYILVSALHGMHSFSGAMESIGHHNDQLECMTLLTLKHACNMVSQDDVAAIRVKPMRLLSLVHEVCHIRSHPCGQEIPK